MPAARRARRNRQARVLGAVRGDGDAGQLPAAEYQVTFEVDEVDITAREGWSVLIQGSAHHVDTADEYASMLEAGVDTWPGNKEHFLRILPTRITGRRIRQR